MKHVRYVAVLLFLLGCVRSDVHAQNTSFDDEKVIDAIRQMYAAAKVDDLSAFHAVTLPSFYSFEGGKRVSGDELMAMMKAFHAAGRKYTWNVTSPSVNINGTHAWITYINRGTMTDASGTTNLTWVESANLVKDGDTWKIDFFHSTRSPQ